MFAVVTEHGEIIEINANLKPEVEDWLNDEADCSEFVKFEEMVIRGLDNEEFTTEDIETWTLEMVKSYLREQS